MKSDYVLRDTTAIVGVGATPYFKNSGVSTLTLALQAVTAAVADAGLSLQDVDGMVCHRLSDSVDPTLVAQALGHEDLRFIRDIFGGGSTSASVVAEAVLAVASGVANCVVCWRSLNARSEFRMGGSGPALLASGEAQYWAPYSHLSAAQLFAMHARAYMAAYGVEAEDLGRVAINQRFNAGLNPQAMMTTPLTMDEYLSSRWIVEPLRLFDCCLETDCAVALIVTSTERARDLRTVPVTISGVAFGGGSKLTSNGISDLTYSGAQAMAPRLYAAAGVTADDIDVAELYDAFTPVVLMQLDAYGFCEPGGAASLVADGVTRLDGRLPVNTHGGHLSEGYAHGLNHVIEAVRQLRGECGPRQVNGAEIALSTSAPGTATGLTAAVILKRGA
jgi:acetyl-CoA acetyltransferase